MHFIEVKATSGDYEAIYRVTPAKLEKILKTIQFYMLKSKFEGSFQIDAIILDKSGVRVIENITN